MTVVNLDHFSRVRGPENEGTAPGVGLMPPWRRYCIPYDTTLRLRDPRVLGKELQLRKCFIICQGLAIFASSKFKGFVDEILGGKHLVMQIKGVSLSLSECS